MSRIKGKDTSIEVSLRKLLWKNGYRYRKNYPGLPGDDYYEVAQKYMPNGTCGVVSFEVKGGRAAAEKFMQNLRIFAIETHVADARSCCLHPASATHRQMTDEQLKACGIEPNMIRLSVGIENKEDIIADLRQAFEKI
jgi:O-acetylhomoserine (thiol)-lyase